jgi:hypothetical protein
MYTLTNFTGLEVNDHVSLQRPKGLELMTIEEQTQGLTSIELPLMVKRKTKKKKRLEGWVIST